VELPGAPAAPVADDMPAEPPEVVPDDEPLAEPPADAEESPDVLPSACAIPDPLASAAPTPRATAPAPSHTWVSLWRCWARWRPFLRRPLLFGSFFAKRSSAIAVPPSLATTARCGQFPITNASRSGRADLDDSCRIRRGADFRREFPGSRLGERYGRRVGEPTTSGTTTCRMRLCHGQRWFQSRPLTVQLRITSAQEGGG
jgi:hypothetical protein